MSDQRPWLVFGQVGMKTIMPAIFSANDGAKASAHYEKIKRKLDGKDEWSASKVRCDDRRNDD